MAILGLGSFLIMVRACRISFALGPIDAGIDREISHSIYPEYRETPRHPAWFPARQLGAPREWSSRYVAVETQNDQRVAYATLWNSGDIVLIWPFVRSGKGKPSGPNSSLE